MKKRKEKTFGWTLAHIDGLGKNFVRRFVSNLLDIHSSLGAGDHDGPASLAVQNDSKIGFSLDVDALGNQELLDEDSLGRCLVSDELVPEHFSRVFLCGLNSGLYVGWLLCCLFCLLFVLLLV